jgi:ribosomal protein S18 acetylase RimI-like enzyme
MRETAKLQSRLGLPRPGPLVWFLRAAVWLAPTRWKFYDESIMLRRSLSASECAVLPEGHAWIWAGPDELKFIDGHPEATSRSAYDRRQARGDSCLCLMKGGELVGYRWIAWHTGCLYCGFGPGQEVTFLPLRKNQAFLYDLYIYKAHRERGYGTLLLELTFKALAGRGIDEVFALVDPDNHAVIRLDQRLGFEAVRMAYAFRIRQWRTMLYGPRDEQMQLQAWMQQFMPAP